MDQINLPTKKSRNIFFAKKVDQSSVNDLAKEIIEINQEDEHMIKLCAVYDIEYKRKPIIIYVDSYGGMAYQCFGLLSIMAHSKTPIHTIVTGCAMSCGFLISISGHKRYAYSTSTLLYHQVSSGTVGKVKDMEEDLIETLRLQEKVEEITIAKTKISKAKLEKIYKRKIDWFISAEEALKLGAIDEIIR